MDKEKSNPFHGGSGGSGTKGIRELLQFRDRCPVCHSPAYELIYERPFDAPPIFEYLKWRFEGRVDVSLLAGEVFRIYECRRCDAVFHGFTLGKFYETETFRAWRDSIDIMQRKEQAKLAGGQRSVQFACELLAIARFLGRPPGDIRVLDFGAGWGSFCLMAKALGFDAYACETDPVKVKQLRLNALRVLDPGDWGESIFDYVWADQVFEHLEDPLTVLRNLAHQVRPGGLLHLRVPDGTGIRDKLKDDANWLKQKGQAGCLNAVWLWGHVNCFSQRSLLSMSALAGFDPVEVVPLHFGSGRDISDRNSIGLREIARSPLISMSKYIRRSGSCPTMAGHSVDISTDIVFKKRVGGASI